MLRTKGRRKKLRDDKSDYRLNERIRVPEVMVIDENGQSLGAMPTQAALQTAYDRGFDLVEVFPKSVPPVCKLLDYGQFLYQQSRKAQEQKAKVKKVETKGVRLSYKIGLHDLEFKKDQAIKFLAKGDKVKLEMWLKGREKAFTGDAAEKMNQFIKMLESQTAIIIEQPVKRQGGQMSALLAPKQ